MFLLTVNHVFRCCCGTPINFLGLLIINFYCADVVVGPPFVYIDQVKSSLTDRIEIAAQNSWIGKGGAFTGEIRYKSSFNIIFYLIYVSNCSQISSLHVSLLIDGSCRLILIHLFSFLESHCSNFKVYRITDK